jgi:hypothetical protein
MLNLDVTKGNIALDRLLAVTENPRHRFILLSFARHRLLEGSGRYEEVFAPDMMTDRPLYSFQALGFNTMLERETIKNMYRTWAETNQTIFYTENEQVAVADNFVACVMTLYQQVWGRSLTLSKVLGMLPRRVSQALLPKLLEQTGHKADPNAMYLYKSHIETIWLYDDRCRLAGEHVWELPNAKPEIIKLDPKDVITTAEAAKTLAPMIRPLPSFDEMVLGRQPSAARERVESV